MLQKRPDWQTEWSEAENFAALGKFTNTVREFGQFIYYDPSLKTYSVGEIIMGEEAKLDGVSLPPHLDFITSSWDMNNPQNTALIEVGQIHTHTPVEWGVRGFDREVGPSDADKTVDMPGMVIDYTNKVYSGKTPASNNVLKIYHYGPNRRALPN